MLQQQKTALGFPFISEEYRSEDTFSIESEKMDSWKNGKILLCPFSSLQLSNIWKNAVFRKNALFYLFIYFGSGC